MKVDFLQVAGNDLFTICEHKKSIRKRFKKRKRLVLALHTETTGQFPRSLESMKVGLWSFHLQNTTKVIYVC